MGYIGNEIIQTRTYVDPTAPAPPDLNYKHTFPITVFEAIRESMDDENSPKLNEVLDTIFKELENKQPIFPARPANYLMTFAGVPGAVGAIQISNEIPWDPTKQSSDRIPTEKAVGELMLKLGLIDEDGNVVDPDATKVRWSDIIGRPLIYEELGYNDDGFITQKAITEAFDSVKASISELSENTLEKVDLAIKKLEGHSSNKNNPHGVTIEQIGAASQDVLNYHMNEAINPHGITPAIIGLGNVNNTSDIDKPISRATQEALDAINQMIAGMTDDVGDLVFIVDGNYDIQSGNFTLNYRNGSQIVLQIPINGLVENITYDKETKELVYTKLSGESKRVSLKDLFIRYIGSSGANITVEIAGDQITGEQTIKAAIVAKSITDNEMADNSVITRTILDQNVTSEKIRDLSITTIKLADGSVTTEKISELAITNSRLDSRSVNGRVLFSSQIPNRILAVIEKDSDPIWTLIVSEMIADEAIQNRNIADRAVTTSKIADKSVSTGKIDDYAVTKEKLAQSSVTNEAIAPRNITGDKLISNIAIPGTPTIGTKPSDNSNGNEIASTQWVLDRIHDMVISHNNLGLRIVDGSNLFSSNIKNRALVTLRADSDPVWGLINNDMMDTDAVDTINIKDLAVTNDKIHDKAIEARHISKDAVQTEHIIESAVESSKIFTSNTANRVLAALTDNGHPLYSQVTRPMIEYNAVGSLQIEDRAVTLSKIQTSDESQRVLAVGLRGTDPAWVQIANKMIGDRAVDGRTLFTSPIGDCILGVTTNNTDPAWVKINGEMLKERIIKREHIENGAIWQEHLQEKIIESRHIADWSIKTNNIAPRAITGIELFTSDTSNRVLAVTGVPYSNPQYVQVNTDMIEDLAITKEKMFQSIYPYRVLGTTQAGAPPEYLMITHQFIVDNTIIPSKLVHDFVLYGTPELTVPPAPDANNYQIPSTSWVRETFNTLIMGVIKEIQATGIGGVEMSPDEVQDIWDNGPDSSSEGSSGSSGSSGGGSSSYPDDPSSGGSSIIFPNSINTNMIKNHAVTGKKLFTHPYGPRVLGITAANEDVEFILIEEDLIVDGAVTTNKIQRDLHLLGSPVLEIRPQPNACDDTGEGQLIPDCQWVLDRIAEILPGGSKWQEITSDEVKNIWQNGVDSSEESGSSGGSGSSGSGSSSGGGITEILPGSITSEMIQKRAIIGSRLFTSVTANRVLAVTESNADPIYTRINNDMIADRVIDPRVLFTSSVPNRILGVRVADEDPAWMLINNEMLEENIIKTEQIVDRAVTGAKIEDYTIDRTKFKNTPMIGEDLLLDDCITTRKIKDDAVTTEKILDRAITSEKLVNDIELPGHPTVPADNQYEIRSLRNIIISPNKPSNTAIAGGAKNGDIWFQYI